ncbi:MAG TPA: twin-arginine translocase TatA/TatE family subunit [Solirubrobacteraceae bacterium]|jgi:sec-independent protein translocase protein TatA|nr:twin-arginine translocase TatA/TatE family subunit [Solirubrobacteraceae bacterium]
MVGDIFQPTHLLFVLVVALLVLGPKKLPEVGRQLGSGLRDFRAAINGEHKDPEEVQAPYEQEVPDTASEHEFASEPSPEPTSNGHEFAHESSAEATSDEHEFAHEPETAAGNDDTAHGEKPDSGHEFAYETSESSDKRTDPLA